MGEQDATQELQHQLAQAVLVRMRLSCLNGARHRRRLRHFLMDWAPLQPLCDACDETLQARGLLERGVMLPGYHPSMLPGYHPSSCAACWSAA